MISVRERFGQFTLREIVVFILCAIILFLLGRRDTYSFIPRWRLDLDTFQYANRQFPRSDELLPSPIITDIESDGRNEIVLVTNDFFLKILTFSSTTKLSTSSVLPHPTPQYVVKIPLNVSEDGRMSHPVAMATGFLAPYQSMLQVRKQVIVLVTDDWYVMCFDHQLKLLWRTQLMNVGQIREHYYMKSMDISVTSVRLHKTDEGLIIVGGAFDHISHRTRIRNLDISTHSDQPFDHNSDTYTHFTTFALSGTDGAVRWAHLPGDFRENPTTEEDMKQAHHWKLALKRGQLHQGEVAWTEFREDILKELPHLWNSLSDTKIQITNIKKSEHQKDGGNPDSATVPSLIGIEDEHIMGYAYGGLRPHSAHEHITNPNSVIVHMHHGMEVLNLFSGRPMSRISLPEGSAVFADINGDGNIEKVKGNFQLSTDRSTTDCTVDVTGLYSSELLFSGKICNHAGLSIEGVFGGRNFEEDMSKTVPPLVISSIAKKTGIVGLIHHLSGAGLQMKRKDKDIITLTSTGIMTSHGSRGELHWHNSLPIRWNHISENTRDISLQEKYKIAFQPTMKVLSLKVFGKKDTAIIVGWNQAAIVDLRTGVLLGNKEIPCQTQSPLVTGDFDNDGYNDLILTCPFGYIGINLEVKVDWMYTLLMKIAIVLLIVLLQWCCSPDRFSDD